MNKRNIKHAFLKAWNDLKSFWAKVFDKIKKVSNKDNNNDIKNKKKHKSIFVIILLVLLVIFANTPLSCNTSLNNQGGVLTVSAQEYSYNNMFGPIYFHEGGLGSLGSYPILQPSLVSVFRDATTGEQFDVGDIFYQNVDYTFPRVRIYRQGSSSILDDKYLLPTFNYLTFTLVYTSNLGYVGYIVGNTFYPFSSNSFNDYTYSSSFSVTIPYYSGNYFTPHNGISGSSSFYHMDYNIIFGFSYYSTNSDFIVQQHDFRYNAAIEGYYGTWNCVSIKYSDNSFVDLACDTGLLSVERLDTDGSISYRPESLYYNSILLSTASGLDLSSVGTLYNHLPDLFTFCNTNKIIEIYCNYSYLNYKASPQAQLSINNSLVDPLEYRFSRFDLPFNVPYPVTMPTYGNFPDYFNGGLPYYCKLVSMNAAKNVGYDVGYDVGYERGKEVGFDEGLDASGYVFNPFESLSKSVNSLLNTPLVSDSNGNTMVSIGTLFRLGIGVLLFGVLIKVFLGG